MKTGIQRAPVHHARSYVRVCRNCSREFLAASPSASWCDTDICQAAKAKFYKQRVHEKKRIQNEA